MSGKIYIFYYNDCIFESAPFAVSLHYTKKGAYQAMRKHRIKCYNEYMEIFDKEFRRDWRDDFGKAWFIGEKEIKP
ncbi:hypothetical protein MUK70_11930 [Dyadobacter chenwenxiniae]|uniref:Uncharacterized protein n=1 Tax=Dyadobacter chenwenxiniae TaxID=2906456 RepID=A0A9X1TBL6_9BACT|nr:hypothetical protein [Dyadobacter chenwenxiniae]MCF0059951.1 hypothetical protein [Dyadobacter chenwenxiniae]UON85690.1 hypothetical protein MUK70_11930 [Dyadobacter chenwenxiniae]